MKGMKRYQAKSNKKLYNAEKKGKTCISCTAHEQTNEKHYFRKSKLRKEPSIQGEERERKLQSECNMWKTNLKKKMSGLFHGCGTHACNLSIREQKQTSPTIQHLEASLVHTLGDTQIDFVLESKTKPKRTDCSKRSLPKPELWANQLVYKAQHRNEGSMRKQDTWLPQTTKLEDTGRGTVPDGDFRSYFVKMISDTTED